MLRLYCILGCLCCLALFPWTSAQDSKCIGAVRTAICPHPDIRFWLYNMAIPFGILLQPGRPPSNFFATPKPLKVLIHSYTGNRDSNPSCQLRTPLLRIPGINIISIDYSTLVPNLCYLEAVRNAHLVGRCLARFLLSFLSRGLILPHDIHLIGFGLGAHVAGFAAKFLSHAYYRVGHITGLDPAKPHFQTLEPSERLDASDADFVDIIHTDVFVHGLMRPIGHADFYPNNGVMQPNCGPYHEITTHLCSHNRATDFYAESIFSGVGFPAFRCLDLHSFISGGCQPNDDIQLMGFNVRRNARGSYFLKTNSFAPYARGTNFNDMDRTLFGIKYYGTELMEKLHELYLEDITLTSTVYIEIMPVECTGQPPFCL